MLLEDDNDAAAPNLTNSLGNLKGSGTPLRGSMSRASVRWSQPSLDQNASSFRATTRISGTDDDEVVQNMQRKLQASSIDVGWIIRRCEDIDQNHHGVIAAEDFLRIFQEACGLDSLLTKRETVALLQQVALLADGSRIRYTRLRELFKHSRDFDPAESKPRYTDDHDRWSNTQVPADAKWAVRSGSVGEWLFTSACPAERRNFVKLIEALEQFERETGLAITRIPSTDDLLVPLGPSLRARIEFSSV